MRHLLTPPPSNHNPSLRFLQMLAAFFLILNNAYGWAASPPPQAAGLSASQGALYGKVSVSWSAATGATQYDLFGSTTAGEKGMLVASNLAGTNYEHTLTDGAHHYYTVAAKNSSGAAPDSAQAEGWGKMPGTVGTLTATQGTLDGKVRLDWAAIPDATSYKVYRASAPGGVGDLLGTAATNSYDDSASTYGAANYYTVVALVGSLRALPGNEAAGWAATPAPLKASGVTATQGSVYGKIVVTWQAAANATHYDLYRSSVGGSKGSPAALNLTGTSFEHGGYINGRHFFYTVVAKNSSGSAPDSTQAEGWPKMPGTAATLTATQGTVDNAVRLDWAVVPDATGYKVYRARAASGAMELMATTTASTHTDTAVGYDDPYYYKVVGLSDYRATWRLAGPNTPCHQKPRGYRPARGRSTAGSPCHGRRPQTPRNMTCSAP